MILSITETYQTQFSEPQRDLWWKLLVEYDIQDLEQALFKHMQNSAFEPKPADLIKRLLPDADAAFGRMIRKEEAQSAIEKATNSAVGYSCRRMAEDFARRLYREEFKRQIELAKQPRMPRSHQLEDFTRKRPTDEMIDQGVEKYRGMSKEEIQKKMREFKIQTKVN